MNTRFIAIYTITALSFFGYFYLSSKSCDASCANPTLQLVNSATAQVFHEQASNPEAIIIDVRTPEEYKTSHIKGAININYNDQKAFINQIESLDKNKHYLVYCRTGNRSSKAALMMQAHGITQITNLDSGIESWINSQLPLIK